MATVAATTDQEPESSPGGSKYHAYKPGEGYASRLGMMVVMMAYAGYGCHHWYYNWVFVRDFFDHFFRGTFLKFLTNWMYEPTMTRFIAGAGTVVLAAVAFAVAYYYIYVNRRSADFLIKTDGELAKVTWPKATPWFRADTQVWGATYVVLLVIAMLTLYVLGIDLVLQWIANNVFYGRARQ